MAYAMQSLYFELDNITDVDACSITATCGDSDDEMGPQCIYHPTLEGFREFQKSESEQFERLRKSKTFALFKKRKERDGDWRSWVRRDVCKMQIKCDEEAAMFTGRSMMTGEDDELDDFIAYMYMMTQVYDVSVDTELNHPFMFCDICGANDDDECIKVVHNKWNERKTLIICEICGNNNNEPCDKQKHKLVFL